MNIGIAAPISLECINDRLDYNYILPKCLESPMIGQLTKKYLELGHRVTIFTLDKDIDRELMIEGDNITIYIGKYRKVSKIRAITFFYTEIKYLKDKINSVNIDVLHCHWTYEFAIAGILSRNSKLIITVHDWAPKILSIYKDLYRISRFFMDRYTFYKGYNFTCVSPYILNKVEEKRGVKCKLIPNFIEDELISHTNKKLNRDEIKIVAINNGFGSLKNTKITMKAFDRINKKIPNSKLIMVGKDYGIGEAAHKWAINNKIDSNIVFMGICNHNEVISILKNADLFVHTSLEESFGNVVVEAMSQKVPVIGGENSGAIPWILGNGNYGILVDVTCEDKVFNAIDSILNDEKKWEKYSINGWKNACENYTLSKIAKRYLKYYENIINSNLEKINEKNREIR